MKRPSVMEMLKKQNKKIHTETMELAAKVLTDEQGEKIQTLNQEITNLSRTIESNRQRVDECGRALDPEKFYENAGEKSEAARQSISVLKKYYETKIAQTRLRRTPLLDERKALFDHAMLTNPGFAFQAHALAATRWAEYALGNVPGEIEVSAIARDKALHNMHSEAEKAEKVYMSAIKINPDQRKEITQSQTKMRITIGKVR